MRSFWKPLRITAVFVSALIVETACGNPASQPPDIGAEAEAPPVAPTQHATLPAPPSRSSGGALSIPVRPAANVPDDIPAHMAWEGLGAGPSSEGCLDAAEAAALSSSPRISEVGLPHGTVFWCYCNLDEQIGDPVTGELRLADGNVQRLETSVDPVGDQVCAEFWHRFDVVPPRQVVTFETRLSDYDIIDRFVPVVGEVLFEGWQPNEPLRLVIYAPEPADPYGDKRFVADLRASADGDGRLALELSKPGEALAYPTIFAIGRSGECQTYDPSLYQMTGRMTQGCTTLDPDTKAPSGAWAGVRWTFDDAGPAYMWEPCFGAPESHLRAGVRAVVKDGLSRVRVRAEPSTQAAIAGHIVPGEQIDILSGPACADGAVWWRIRSLQSGLAGWSMEGDAEEAWLLPLP